MAWAVMAAIGCQRPLSTDHTGVASGRSERACFLLHELGIGRLVRDPADACDTRVTPASTFKIAHALAGLDSGVVEGPNEQLRYEGTDTPFPSHQRDHTLASAMRYSVVWYFQRMAENLGPEREQAYLNKLQYGNRDSSSGLTSFWLAGSLRISPEEQEQFLIRLYLDRLPVSGSAQRITRDMLVQPPNAIVNATGEHSFAAPWPAGTTLSSKTGSATTPEGEGVRWLVGHVARGQRAWVFVSCVVGPGAGPMAAVDLAASALRRAQVL